MPIEAGSHKSKLYTDVTKEIMAVLQGETNPTAKMATVACMLSQAFDHFFWTGFYLIDPEDPETLVVGPYQGTLGCLRIAFGRGVCGLAAQSRTTQIVADMHAHPNHIACDSRSNSEIVVPVFDAAGGLMAVLDVDSTAFGAFDEIDAQHLEGLMRGLFSK